MEGRIPRATYPPPNRQGRCILLQCNAVKARAPLPLSTQSFQGPEDASESALPTRAEVVWHAS